MEHPDSKETGDEKGAGAAGPGDPWPNTAIERQMATASTRSYRERSHQEVTGRAAGRRKMVYSTDRRKSRLGLAIFLVFLLLVAAALAWVFTGLGRPPQNAVSAVPPMVEPAATPRTPSPANTAQTAVPKNGAEASASGELSIPIADASLRNRPELLEQLVQVYRSKLADDPRDATALTALNQLRERSLAELETIIAEGDDAAAGKSLQIVSRLFPELAENSRYKYLVVRRDFIHSHAPDESAATSEQSAPSTPTTSPEKTTSAEKITSPEKAVAAPIDSAATVAKKAVENTQPQKPEIRAVSITPGRMVENRFIPGDGGNALMVEISYRNFEKAFEDSSEVTLVTRLGIPGDSTVLAEVPIVISGDRGTKSFLMDTLASGNTGNKYQLNFLLNGEFFASRMVRVSVPGY